MRRDSYQAIADPTRRGILVSLTKERKNLNTLAAQFDMSRQAVSLHVKFLHECGVISVEKEGRERYCYLKVEKLMEIKDWLEPFRQIWQSRFSALDNLLDELQTKPPKTQ